MLNLTLAMGFWRRSSLSISFFYRLSRSDSNSSLSSVAGCDII